MFLSLMFIGVHPIFCFFWCVTWCAILLIFADVFFFGCNAFMILLLINSFCLVSFFDSLNALLLHSLYCFACFNALIFAYESMNISIKREYIYACGISYI
jgi:hypothetical protein